MIFRYQLSYFMAPHLDVVFDLGIALLTFTWQRLYVKALEVSSLSPLEGAKFRLREPQMYEKIKELTNLPAAGQ